MNINAAYDMLSLSRRARRSTGKLNFKFATYMMILFISIVILSETLAA